MRPAEAASVCGISPEAMRQRLTRARAALAARLEGDVPAVAALREVVT
jgi:DNA-directed RNA polymerase specialized sigma24 family protein